MAHGVSLWNMVCPCGIMAAALDAYLLAEVPYYIEHKPHFETSEFVPQKRVRLLR